MTLYVVHGNTYYDGYGHIENLFGIYTEKDQAEAAKDTVIKELYNKEIARGEYTWIEDISEIEVGMRNPMNSWEKSDSYAGHEYMGSGNEYFNLGSNDHSLMQRLSKAGTDHRKYMRMMPVYVRITAPIYW